MRHVGAQHQLGGRRRHNGVTLSGALIAVLSLVLGSATLSQQSAVADDAAESIPADASLDSSQSGQKTASPNPLVSDAAGESASPSSDQSGVQADAPESTLPEGVESSTASSQGEGDASPHLLEPRSSRISRAPALQGIRGALSCDAGQYYTIAGNGEVRGITSINGIPNSSTSSALNLSQSTDVKKSYNGLAVGSGGDVVYAYNRSAGRKEDKLGIIRWQNGDSATQVYLGDVPEIKDLYDYKNKPVTGTERGSLIAGGIDPTDPNGDFYFGGFFYFKPYDKASGNYTYFHLLKYSQGQVTTVGYINIRRHKADLNNGDLAFSAAGDLFILWNDGDGKTKIVPVRKDDLKDANGGEIRPSGETSEMRTSDGKYNGLAFDGEGNLFIQYSDSGKTFNYSIDPDTGEKNGNPVQLSGMPSGQVGNDLGSCANPSTLFLVKDLVGRDKAGDQFEISVVGKNNTVLATDETEGAETGETASAGIFIVKKDRWYTLKERALNGADMSKYKTTLSCINTYTGHPIPDSELVWNPNDPTTARVFVATGESKDIVCTFRNEPKPKVGDVIWSKVSSKTGEKLPGAVWQIKPADGSAPIEVTDNTGEPSYSGRDTNASPGEFKVEGLPIGRYVLHEKTAPAGYLPGNDKPFEINAGNISTPIDLRAIENKRLPQVSWTKVKDTATGELIEGSVWTWKPTNPAGSAFDVSDCVKASAAQCTGKDADPAKGKFLLKDVKPGAYTLTEKTAPEGYQLDATVHRVTVKDEHADTTVVLGPFVNLRLKGSATWSKVDAEHTDQRLAGSTWTLTGPDVPVGTVISDCEAAPCGTGLFQDVNPEPGVFKLEGLIIGDYTLVEKTAPVGFDVDTTPHDFSITSAALNYSFADGFPNQRHTAPNLPFTGGMSTDRVMIIGTAFVLLAGATAFVIRRRRARA